MIKDHSDRLFWGITACLTAATAVGIYVFACATPAPPRAAGSRAPSEQRAERAAPRPRSSFSRWAQLRRTQVFAQVQGDEAFMRLGEPEPGDWLWHFREHGQTLEEYAAQAVNRKTDQRSRLHLQPFSDLSGPQLGVVEPMRAHTAIFFDAETVLLPPRHPERAWLNERRGQYNADEIVEQMARKVPLTSLGLFGLMGSDLYGLRLNFVFGEALLDRRAGIYSVHRFGREPSTLLRRALKLSAHEIGHMFGMQHCIFYDCVMNGTNSLPETDRRPLHLCPVCLAKLQWNLRFDPAKRYRALAAFYRKHGLGEEARFAEARAKEL
jgi:archaemetzincin